MIGKSEAGQDQWVLEKLGRKRGGFFIDAGAHDGVICSNTLVMERDYGWDGICIEGGLPNYRMLAKNRVCRCVQACLHSANEPVRFFDLGLNSSLVADGRDIGSAAQGITLEHVLDACHAPEVIDYLSIDIEGHEFEVLRVFPFDRYKFRTMTVEHNSYSVGTAHRDRLRELLTGHGYVLDRADVTTPAGQPYEDWYVMPERGSTAPISHGA